MRIGLSTSDTSSLVDLDPQPPAGRSGTRDHGSDGVRRHADARLPLLRGPTGLRADPHVHGVDDNAALVVDEQLAWMGCSVDGDACGRHRVEWDLSRPGQIVARAEGDHADRPRLMERTVASQGGHDGVQRPVAAADDHAPVATPAECIRRLGGAVGGADLEVARLAKDGKRVVEAGAAALSSGSVRHGQEPCHSTMMATADERRA